MIGVRRLFGAGLLVAFLSLSGAPARAQVVGGAAPIVQPPASFRMNGYYTAPGYYGTSFGSPSYGSVRTYTAFSSPYGGGYGNGYAPYGLLPGRYGVGLWRPGFVSPGYTYGASYYSYRTFPVPYPGSPASVVQTPGIGAYAPAYGPPSYQGW